MELGCARCKRSGTRLYVRAKRHAIRGGPRTSPKKGPRCAMLLQDDYAIERAAELEIQGDAAAFDEYQVDSLIDTILGK